MPARPPVGHKGVGWSRPPRDFNVSGWRRTGDIRIRSTWFGLARCEELWQSRDGLRKWKPVLMPVKIGSRDGEIIMQEALESISGMWDAQAMINRADEALDKVTGGKWSK